MLFGVGCPVIAGDEVPPLVLADPESAAVGGTGEDVVDESEGSTAVIVVEEGVEEGIEGAVEEAVEEGIEDGVEDMIEVVKGDVEEGVGGIGGGFEAGVAEGFRDVELGIGVAVEGAENDVEEDFNGVEKGVGVDAAGKTADAVLEAPFEISGHNTLTPLPSKNNPISVVGLAEVP